MKGVGWLKWQPLTFWWSNRSQLNNHVTSYSIVNALRKQCLLQWKKKHSWIVWMNNSTPISFALSPYLSVCFAFKIIIKKLHLPESLIVIYLRRSQNFPWKFSEHRQEWASTLALILHLPPFRQIDDAQGRLSLACSAEKQARHGI